MAQSSLHGLVQRIRTVAAAHTNRALADRELLERFIDGKDEAAFTVLIERHGPMVFGVCRRVLPNYHDAEDACQATFLVLPRKAAAIRNRQSLGSWLHGVAYRAAGNLKRTHARRLSRERCADASVPRDPAAEVTWREVQGILDDELQRLPDRYRTPLILCCLECLTRDEAARQLGLSPTTLHGRLERARNLLRARLGKRGLTLAAVMSATVGDAVQAAVAPTLVVSSTKAAMMLGAGQPVADGMVAPRTLALMQEVLKTMLLTKVKWATAAAICAGFLVALAAGSSTSLTIAQETKPASAGKKDAPPAQPESDADFIRRLSKDLRGIDPSPTEVHFFVTSKDPNRRQKLIDLFIQERQVKNDATAKKPLALDSDMFSVGDVWETRELFLGQRHRMVEIRPRATGHVVKVACKPGAEVKKGDLLIEIDPRPYQAQWSAAQATVAQHQAAVDLATATYQRSRELAKKQPAAISQPELELHQAQERQARAALQVAQANLELAKLNLDATAVRAPIDGKIGSVLVTQGELATADKTVLVTLIQVTKSSK
jgi:RNA polymerase sigma factor (sigma-70 family)